MNTCYECGCEFRGNGGTHLRCWPCGFAHDKRAGKAHAVVAKWVRQGMLPNLKTYEVACRDCGERADRYDHRDYGKPLWIAPVCRRCNIKRGPALPMRAAA